VTGTIGQFPLATDGTNGRWHRQKMKS